MKLEGSFRQISRWALIAAMLLIPGTSTSVAYAAMMTISPASGTEVVGQLFSVSVNVSGLDSMNDLYAYSFDLAFDPTVFEVLAANDGTVFDYAGNSPVYIDGTIDNQNGFVTLQSGLDTNASFTGTGGLLGSFSFEALRALASTEIAVQNVSLSTFAAASDLLPPDIDPGTLPVATLETVPEPAPGALAAFILACGVMVRRSLR
jgi:hypothetical protein